MIGVLPEFWRIRVGHGLGGLSVFSGTISSLDEFDGAFLSSLTVL